ncbi:MAG: HNH endonuclease [Candidatus Marinimicrobia bacterium]|nr:HNH endonuclease [Candidatus Neomarinimicrobiota bacterium]
MGLILNDINFFNPLHLYEGEEWLPISEFEDYQISNYGRVKKWHRGELIIFKWGSNGKYAKVVLYNGGVRKDRYIHRLVALHFIENKEGLKEVNHKYGQRLDNYYKNLEWSTRSKNAKHGYDNGLIPLFRGTRSFKVTPSDKIKIRNTASNNNFSLTKLSGMFNLHRNTIKRILNQKPEL